jgi:hypothetical protein
LAICLIAGLHIADSYGGTFTVTPNPALAGGILRFQATMTGDPTPDEPFNFVAGHERPMGVRIVIDRSPGKNPGTCNMSRSFSMHRGTDLDFSGNTGGPAPGWMFFGSCLAEGLPPGDYIISLDYALTTTTGSIDETIHTISIPISIHGDRDRDGIPDPTDNCPLIANPGQEDLDGDTIGDICDPDRDGDGILNDLDNCPNHFNPSQIDSDRDRLGDTCDPNPFDRDNDGVNDELDNCPNNFNPTQDDNDDDGIGNACETDLDGDGVLNAADNCPLTPNPDQRDSDLRPDRQGDACDPPDSDGDGVLNTEDNCPATANADQKDTDGDGTGDACDENSDSDGDGIADAFDNCPSRANPFQEDADNDGLGDICETNDSDGDGWANGMDNCPFSFNPGQFDADQDGIGDNCDPDRDPDGDGIPDSADNCTFAANPGQEDANANGIGDACDRLSDTDADGLSDSEETQIGSNPGAFNWTEPGINTYTDGQLTSSANAASSGDRVAVAIPVAANINSVAVTVTDPEGNIILQDTLVPQSPVVFFFTANSRGNWRLTAKLYSGANLVTTYERNLAVIEKPPILSIQLNNGAAQLSWPLPAAGFVLDQTTNLVSSAAASPWTLSALPYQTNASHISVTLPISTGTSFYRLRKP